MAKQKRATPARTATRKPDRVVPVRSRPGYRPQPLRSDEGVIEGLVQMGEAEQVLALLPALLWIDSAAYKQWPSNLCLDATHTLRQAYQWLGMRADVVPVQLSVEHAAGRRPGTMYGNAHPHYNGKNFAGHCVLRLPDVGRVIDATAGQFPEIARGTGAPIVARDPSGTHDLLDPTDTSGAQLFMQREDWNLIYSPVGPEYADIVYEGPCAAADAQFGFHENGMKIVAQMLGLLSLTPESAAHARQTSSPRLGPLMDAISGAQWTPEDDRLDLFVFPDGTARQLRELPLPAGTAPALNETRAAEA